jgi:hypothetical protein
MISVSKSKKNIVGDTVITRGGVTPVVMLSGMVTLGRSSNPNGLAALAAYHDVSSKPGEVQLKKRGKVRENKEKPNKSRKVVRYTVRTHSHDGSERSREHRVMEEETGVKGQGKEGMREVGKTLVTEGVKKFVEVQCDVGRLFSYVRLR